MAVIKGVRLGFGWATEWMNGSKMTDHLKGTLDLNTKLNLDSWQPSRLIRKGNFWFWIPVNGWRNPKGWWPISPPLLLGINWSG